MCRHLPGRKSGAKHRTSANWLIFRDIRERHTQETNGMQHAFVFVCGSWKFSWSLEIQGVEMGRVVACLILLGFFTSASLATARNGDSETPSRKVGNKPAAKSEDSTKPEERHDLRKRLTAVEAGAAVSKETAAPTSASPAGVIQPWSSAAITAVSMSPNAASQGAAHDQNENKSPLSFKIGSADFTPGGFLDFTTFFRSTNVGSGIATGFGSIPFNNQLPQARLSETRLSAQYSRLSLKVDTHLTESTSLTGYVETDFLGFQPANAYQTANSDSLRLRLYWANVRHGKWEVLAGQEWSLLTPNRIGLSPLTPDVFYTLDEDPNFQVGLTWARQPQFRVV